MKKISILAVILFIPLSLSAANLTIQMKNFRSDNGKVFMEIYNDAQAFWKRKGALKSLKGIQIKGNQAKVVVSLEKGTYAVSLYHDENENGKMEFNPYQQPLEGWGVSKNRRGYPKFEAAAIKVENQDLGIVINLFYASKVSFLIKGLRNTKGKLMAGIYYNQKSFLKPDGAIAGSKEIKIDSQQVAFDFMLLQGNYAASVVHDENGNDELDTNFIGIPKEGYGFSRNAMGSLGPPKFKDAAFFVGPDAGEKQVIELKY